MAGMKWLMVLGLLIALNACSDQSQPPQPRLTESEAIAAAKPEMAQRFPDSVEKHQPYRAQFSLGVWHVRGTLPPGSLGGTPDAQVRDADGEVLRVSHTQ